jgi:multiple sugar transport system ATP-binding protein
MATVEYQHATCVYPGMASPAVDDLDLRIEDGELMVLVGPSGSGKSTALRMLAGLEVVHSGEISIGGRVVTSAAPKARDIAMVFQSYALYPHLTVAENMAFPLKQKRVPAPERQQRVLEAARLLELEPYLDRRPRQLSGGQRQRVAMGRAIVRQPQAFLMDEPLSNLDAKLRVQTRAEIAALQQRLGVTTIYVTHDQVEAMTLGHRVAVLKDGRLQQCDTPRNLYEHPRNVFVAGFVGSPAMNLDRLPFDGTAACIGDTPIPLPGAAAAAARQAGLSEVVLGLRPDSLTLAGSVTAPNATSSNGTPSLSCRVHLVEDTGSDAWVHLDVTQGPSTLRLVARADARQLPSVGDQVRVSVAVSDAHVFDPGSGERLGG